MQQKHLFKRVFLYLAVLPAILSGLGNVSIAADRAAPPRRIRPANRRLPQDVLAKKNMIYASVDGTNLELDLYIPQKAEGPMPLVVWIHGGGWRSGSKENCRALGLTEYGFAVASINYRLTDVAMFPAQIHDCKAAIRFLRANAKKYSINPDCIGVWGSSAGGHLAALMGVTNGNKEVEGTVGKHTQTASDVQAVCDWCGPTDFMTMPVNRQQFRENNPVDALLGKKGKRSRQLVELACPLSHVSGNGPPFLIMHGDEDNVVSLHQSQMFYDRLKAEGVDAKLIVAKGLGHNVGQSPESFKPVIEFFRRTLNTTEKELPFEIDTIQTAAGQLSITFIGHGTLMMQVAGKTIHIDPWTKPSDYTALPKADIILITHEHSDHLEAKAVKQIRKESTTVILTQTCSKTIAGGIVMKNGDTQKLFENVTVEAVPAYNIAHKRSNGQPYHPKGVGNGYILNFGGTRIYVAGDTENTPEMKALKNIDIAFLPMNLPYTMTPEMVADAAKALKPKILYPYHYGQTDTRELTKLMADQKETEVRIRKMQ